MDTLNQGGMSVHDLPTYEGTVSPRDTVAVIANQRESGKRKRVMGNGVDAPELAARKKQKGANGRSIVDAG